MPDKTPLEGWDSLEPAAAGFEAEALAHVIAYARASESAMNRDIGQALADGHFGEPWPIGAVIGLVRDRADPSGVILRHGKIVATWGDVARVDMTFSISKSYLALCAGIAVDDGLIPDIDAPVRDLLLDGGFDDPQNRDITWRHLLELTSEWQGTLWDKPDWIDHNRVVMGQGGTGAPKGERRALHPPGTYWEYNDVRVNVASLALMRVFERPLPEVLQERVMRPIGASDTWQWHGYETSWIDIAGRRMQAVSGGAHWGGGLWISTLDHARVGQLMLNKGLWNGARVLSDTWVETMTTACALNPAYGLFWWLNAGSRPVYRAASRSSFFGIGVGTNLLWVDPENAMVVVARWIDSGAVDGFVARVMTALQHGDSR